MQINKFIVILNFINNFTWIAYQYMEKFVGNELNKQSNNINHIRQKEEI